MALAMGLQSCRPDRPCTSAVSDAAKKTSSANLLSAAGQPE
jgi:hypothetical protein